MRKISLLSLLFFSSCLSQAKLAQKCLENFPCNEIHKSDTIETITHTITESVIPVETLPMVKCFEYSSNKAVEIHQLPLAVKSQVITKTVNHWYEDSAKLKLAVIAQHELAKSNDELSNHVLLLENEVGRLNAKKRHTEWYAFAVTAGLILLLTIVGIILWLASKIKK